MKNILQQLSALSALRLSDSEIKDLSFSDISSIIDNINEFEFTDEAEEKALSFSDLRDDIPVNTAFTFKINSISRIIS